MATDDQEILSKISQLAGQINRHKNGQPVDQQLFSNLPSRGNYRGGYTHSRGGWGASRGTYPSRGYVRGGRAQVHRNRTLVLNSNSVSPAIAPSVPNYNGDGVQPLSSTTVDSPSWITKTDRHLQLINSSVFGEESQRRAKAMEETRKLKLKQREEIEKSKLSKHLYRMSASSGYVAQPHSASGNYEINVEGIQFQVVKDGSKLVKVPGEPSNKIRGSSIANLGSGLNLLDLGDSNAAKATPKVAMVGGVKFHRSKNGNMFRAGIIKAHRRTGMVKKINEPCKMFSTTGSCSKGPRCRYIHDPTKVAVCKEFLLRSSCPSGDSCDLSHDLTPERTPFCLHFAKGNCSNSSCPYAHVRVTPGALVCRPFGFYGYCEKGSSCEQRHVHECPDFSNTGNCTTKGCKLPHRHKASVMRTNTGSAEEDSSDISSDDEQDEIDSDDVDSDDLEGEFLGNNGKPDSDALRQDFVHFS